MALFAAVVGRHSYSRGSIPCAVIGRFQWFSSSAHEFQFSLLPAIALTGTVFILCYMHCINILPLLPTNQPTRYRRLWVEIPVTSWFVIWSVLPYVSMFEWYFMFEPPCCRAYQWSECACVSSWSWWRHQMETSPRYWSFVRGIHRSSVNSPRKDQWRGALMFSLICAWINGWVNHRVAGDWDAIVLIMTSRGKARGNISLKIFSSQFKFTANFVLISFRF